MGLHSKNCTVGPHSKPHCGAALNLKCSFFEWGVGCRGGLDQKIPSGGGVQSGVGPKKSECRVGCRVGFDQII